MTFTPPSKRTTGQCTCIGDAIAAGRTALYPLPSEPDALTKLTRLVRDHCADTTPAGEGPTTFEEQALALISESEEERKALEALAERRKQARLDALSVTTTEGLNASEWMLRTGKAERERDEARRLHGTLVLDASAKVAALEAKLAAQQETINALSNKATAALRMGQQQGRVELAQEILAMESWDAANEYLADIVSDDAKD